MRILRADTDADVLVRTVAESGRNANAVRLIGRTDNLDAVKRLVSNPEVGADARTLVNQFDDPDTLEAFFELDFARINNPKLRANIARLRAISDIVRGSEITRYINDPSEIRRLSENGVEINDADRIARAVTDRKSGALCRCTA